MASYPEVATSKQKGGEVEREKPSRPVKQGEGIVAEKTKGGGAWNGKPKPHRPADGRCSPTQVVRVSNKGRRGVGSARDAPRSETPPPKR